MDEVQFDEDKVTIGQTNSQKVPFSARVFIKMGIIRNPDNAHFVLIAITLICFLIAAFNILHFIFKIF